VPIGADALFLYFDITILILSQLIHTDSNFYIDKVALHIFM